MAEVVPTPTQHANAPQNAPTAPVAPTPPAPDASADVQAKYKTLEAEHQKRVREHVIERRRWDAQRKEVEPKLARLTELEKREQYAKTNPTGFLKSLYGEKWDEIIMEAKVHGTTPAQLVAEEMQKLREENDAKWKARDEADAKRAETAKAQQVEQARKTLFAEGAEWYRTNEKEFPLLADLGPAPAVARMLAQEIESTFNRTHEEGVKQGRVLTMKEAAEALEGRLVDLASKATKHEKYKAKLQPPPASGTVAAAASESQQGKSQPDSKTRRSITNDITGSTHSEKPPQSPAEKRARALAAFDAARRKET